MDKDASGHVRVAIVGSGQMAGARGERLANSSHTSVVAVAARNQKTGTELAAQHGVEYTQDWRATVRRPDVDAVVLTTHPDTRAEMGMAVLSAGKHLFTESPLAMSPREGSRLLAVANENGLVIRVGHTSVIRPAQCLIREQIAALGGPVHDLFSPSEVL